MTHSEQLNELAAQQPSLITKLTEVMAAVDRIPKRGKNAHFGYQYATEADVSDVLRQELSKRHVLMVMGITDIINSPSERQTMTLVRLNVSFHDGDSDAVLTFPWAGAGQDSGEKGLYKAMTGAEKYALLKTFLVPTGDDPEDDNGKVPPPQAQASQPTRMKDVGQDQQQTAVQSGPVTVKSVDKRDGTSKAGKPFVAYTVTLSDGRKCGTLNAQLANTAIEFGKNNTPVEAVTEKNGNFLNLMELIIVQAPQTPEEPDLGW